MQSPISQCQHSTFNEYQYRKQCNLKSLLYATLQRKHYDSKCALDTLCPTFIVICQWAAPGADLEEGGTFVSKITKKSLVCPKPSYSVQTKY